MKILKYTLLFLAPMVLTLVITYFYFEFSNKISNITIANIPSVTFSDLIKISRFSLEKAPSQSLIGELSSLSGDVFYTPRLATESAKINSPREIQQGEDLATGDTGNFILSFKNTADIKVNSKSSLSVIQTLPANLVFKQTLGSVEYIKTGDVPLSVRVGHLLIENNGDILISFTADNPITVVKTLKGGAVVAYNNLNNSTKVLNLMENQTLKFNESNRVAKIESH